jgi:hypothetical protein
MVDDDLDEVARQNDYHGNTRARAGRKIGSGFGVVYKQNKLKKIFLSLRSVRARKEKAARTQREQLP